MTKSKNPQRDRRRRAWHAWVGRSKTCKDSQSVLLLVRAAFFAGWNAKGKDQA